MRAFHAIVLLLLIPAWVCGVDRYVATSGSNGNPGTLAQPWATITYALANSAGGERILLNRGDTFRETFSIGGGRELAAYGSGAAPVITASAQVLYTGNWGSNTNVKTVAAASQVRAVWVDGVFVNLARYPNANAGTPWLRVDNGTTVGVITDAELPARSAGRWTNAQVRWRRWSWWWETRTITSDGGGSTLSLASTSLITSLTGTNAGGAPDTQGSSYFIDNDSDELDVAGEWFWGGGTLNVYPPGGGSTTTAEVVTGTGGITSTGATFRDLAFRRFGGKALSLNGLSTVEDCTFEEIEDTAIAVTWGGGGSQIRRCVLRDVRNVGISWNADPAGPGGGLVERNLLHRIGVRPGYGGSGTWHAAGLIIYGGKPVTVQLNRVVETGYAGIILGLDGTTVNRNVFVRTMSTLNDGAAVYANCNATNITENIILDTIGDLSTSQPWYPLGHGIWPEFLKDFHDQVITDNTIFGSNGSGIFLGNEYTCTVSRNVIADCRTQGLILDVSQNSDAGDTNSYGVNENADNDLRGQGHAITDNLIATSLPTKRISRAEYLTKWWLAPYSQPEPSLVTSYGTVDFGTMSGSTFIVPAAATARFIGENPSTAWSSLPAWAAANSSWAQNGTRLVVANTHLLINDTGVVATIPVPAGIWTLPDGSAVGASIEVEPFRSVAIITTGSLPGVPYTVASGINWRAATPTSSVYLGASNGGPGPGSGGGGGGGGGGSGGGGGGGGCGAGGGSLAGFALVLVALAMACGRLPFPGHRSRL